MTLQQLTEADVEEIIGAPFDTTARRCHEVSLAIVRSGRLPVRSRVARGFCRGVPSQHSWVVLGWDCFDLATPILDATLWSYVPTVTGVWTDWVRGNGRHMPHGGAGDIWSYGRPRNARGKGIALTPTEPLSDDARLFLDILGPLDRTGWATLASAPVLGGWPAAEIIAAMDDTEAVRTLVPIDRLGMLTDRNPGGLYF